MSVVPIVETASSGPMSPEEMRNQIKAGARVVAALAELKKASPRAGEILTPWAEETQAHYELWQLTRAELKVNPNDPTALEESLTLVLGIAVSGMERLLGVGGETATG